MVNEPVDRGDGDSLVWEDLVPGTEGLVGRDGEAPGLVTPGDQFEEDGALGLIFLRVGYVIEDDQVELVELRERGLESEVAAGGLELLHHVGGAGVKDAVPGLDEGVADGAQDVAFARARVADGDEVGAGLAPNCLRPAPRCGPVSSSNHALRSAVTLASGSGRRPVQAGNRISDAAKYAWIARNFRRTFWLEGKYF